MKYLEKIEERLCDALEGMSGAKLQTSGELDAVHKMTDTIKNIEKIKALKGESDYSNRGSYDRGSYRRDSMGRYARDDGYDREYSRHDAKHKMAERIEEMMRDADDEQTRSALRKCLTDIR